MTSKPLTILFLVESAHEQGTYFRWHNLAIGLQAMGHTVTVYAVDWNRHSANRTEYKDGIKYCFTRAYRGFSLFTPSTNPFMLLRRFTLDYPRCDVVHSFQPFPASAYLGWYLKKTGRASYFFYDWDDLWVGGLLKKPLTRLLDKVTYPLVRHIEKRFPARADFVTTCSTYLRQLAVQSGAKNTSIIHNGFWPFSVPDKQQARATLGLQPDVFYIGFMGRTSSELSWCVAAQQALVAQNLPRPVRLVLCGMPDFLLDEFSAEQKETIDYLGYLSPLDCRLFAAAIDVGLLPLQDDAFNQSRFPIKFAEYQASGTPVVHSEIGECNELSKQFSWNVKAGTTKQQFIDATVMAVCEKITGERNEPVDRDKLASALSWTLLAQQLAAEYSRVVGRKLPETQPHLQP